MDRIADAFAWPFHDPGWLTKILLIGLILVIPVIGAINGIGWMLSALDRLRAGDQTLPPAGLQRLGRGMRLFVVFLVYGLALTAIAGLVYTPAVLILARAGQGPVSAGLITLGVLLSVMSYGVATLGFLVLNFATPAIILETERAGIVGGLRVSTVLRRCRASAANTLIAGLMLIAAGFVGSSGAIACGIGILFTTAYSLAMQAWIVRSFEVGSTAVAAA